MWNKFLKNEKNGEEYDLWGRYHFSKCYAAIQAPASLAASYTLTLPVDDGSTNQVLSTNGSGVLAWIDSSSGATGAGTDEVFVENGQTVTGSYSLSTNKNAHLVGPVALNSGVVVTVPANATLLIH